MTDSFVVNGLTEDAQFGPGSEYVPEAYGVSASATQPVTLYFRDLDFAASPDGTVHEMGVAGDGIFIGVAGSNFRVAFGTPANGQTVLDYALSNLPAGFHDVIVALDPVSGDAVLYIDDVLEARATGPGSALWSVGDGDGTYGGLDFIVVESTGDVTLLSAAPDGDYYLDDGLNLIAVTADGNFFNLSTGEPIGPSSINNFVGIHAEDDPIGSGFRILFERSSDNTLLDMTLDASGRQVSQQFFSSGDDLTGIETVYHVDLDGDGYIGTPPPPPPVVVESVGDFNLVEDVTTEFYHIENPADGSLIAITANGSNFGLSDGQQIKDGTISDFTGIHVEDDPNGTGFRVLLVRSSDGTLIDMTLDASGRQASQQFFSSGDDLTGIETVYQADLDNDGKIGP